MNRETGSKSIPILRSRKDNKGKQILERILHKADVQIGGNRDWDIQVRNPAFFNRLLAGGSLALGESYMDGWWECEALDCFFDKILSARLDKTVRKSIDLLWAIIRSKLINPQHSSRAFEIGKRHYDIGNDLFCVMLDKGMNYSCGYWHKAMTLEEAQKDKLDLICRKIGLTRGMKVLDIGCGWGGFAKYAAETYGVNVFGITVSKEQVKLAENIAGGSLCTSS